jgi:ribosomal protein S27AE
MNKHLGKCPFCNESVRPRVIEENSVRRDICRCPECSNSILVCRTPGCQDYAKGGEIYDDEFCPECTKGAHTTLVGTVFALLLAKLS